MLFQQLIKRVRFYGVAVMRRLENRFKEWIKNPSPQSLVVGTMIDVARDKHNLITENVLHRHQLTILQMRLRGSISELKADCLSSPATPEGKSDLRTVPG